MIGDVAKLDSQPPIPSLRVALRDGTRDWHDRVEDAFAVFDLDRSEGLRDFLLAQARAVLPLERMLDRFDAADLLPDWPMRRRGFALRTDLGRLGAAVPSECDAPDLSSVEQRIGALYVLEGSRLGGRVLARRVAATGTQAPTSFLLHSAGAGAWASFLALLERRDLVRDEVVAAACSAFRMFGEAASLQAAASRARHDYPMPEAGAGVSGGAREGQEPDVIASGGIRAPKASERRASC